MMSGEDIMPEFGSQRISASSKTELSKTEKRGSHDPRSTRVRKSTFISFTREPGKEAT
jgi:hypothetical protein